MKEQDLIYIFNIKRSQPGDLFIRTSSVEFLVALISLIIENGFPCSQKGESAG